MSVDMPLFLRALHGLPVLRPPVWMMRQAGRYLPEYRALRERYSFFERCENPELVCEITLQPLRVLDVDAAILFSDILVVPKAMGMQVELVENKGPYLPQPIRTTSDLNRLHISDPYSELDYVLRSIGYVKEALPKSVPLLGFAGAPWTILCYMVQGSGSKGFEIAKQWVLQEPKLAHNLLEMITESTIAYLLAQADRGVDAVQIFDSWAGLWDKDNFENLILPYTKRIVQALINNKIPCILFSRGTWYSLKSLQETGANAISLDWQTPASYARHITENKVTLQGNLDPSCLLLPVDLLRKTVLKMCQDFGIQKYIANLGHGILPNVPIENAKIFVDTIKNYQSSNL